jgi:hypothetical protein
MTLPQGLQGLTGLLPSGTIPACMRFCPVAAAVYSGLSTPR